MSEPSESTRAARARAGWVILAVVLVIVVVAVVWALIAGQSGGREAGAETPAASPSPSAEAPTREPSALPTPTPGATEGVEKPQEVVEVPIDEVARTEGVAVEVESVEAVTAGRDIPGEKSGPAVKVTIRIVNESETPVDTAGASVNLTYGGEDRTPATPVTDPDATLWPVSVAPGESATAVFIFAVPLDSEGDLRVTVDLLATAPDVVFVGPRPV